MSALHVFDMDGTLLRGTSAALQISRRLDCEPALQDLERRFDDGELEPWEFAVAVRGAWGELDPALVADVVADAPWMDGIDEVCADIAARGETSMLVTLSPTFFARHLHERGIDVVHGSVWADPIDPAAILTPGDKVRLAEEERERLGLPTGRCVAYGDSGTDVPLFAHLTHTVAVNARPGLEAAADYRGSDLREAYALGREMLDR
ncbi:HAD family hydrolase [Actinomycetospora termitidis]|uniref:Haloacid dehalogenase-like hydrolase n=1 Tax=Actinomycetospora termitidis TaxID=3053470 RepID=A0ABT7MAB4_9PSEU|nr:haloacid dehalogenase-like hydrolase [Actinomycetospora sp. Odt1-22]MDL5157598.1 haloacid dehalogenase-like hydrolase [Actinomycetospora sp. Odt1-22]